MSKLQHKNGPCRSQRFEEIRKSENTLCNFEPSSYNEKLQSTIKGIRIGSIQSLIKLGTLQPLCSLLGFKNPDKRIV